MNPPSYPAGAAPERAPPGPARGAFAPMLHRFLPIGLLIFSNVFMTYAWYGHLKDFRTKPILIVVALSWGVAFFEYCLQVPANRIGSEHFSLAQLKVMQEVITMCVFAVFSVMYMKQKLTADFFYAGLCLVGAAYFMFRQIASSH
jgi:uncharacterized protein (DUF486 family)